MKILSLELSTALRSVAAVDCRSGASGEAQHLQGVQTPIFRLIEEALASAGWDRSEVEALAVGIGPGSYTGIRLAIATVQGWQLVRPVQVLAVESLQAMAWQALKQGWEGELRVAVDAHREEFYVADFRLSGDQVVVMEPLRLVPLESLKGAGTRPLAGPGLGRWFPEARELYPLASTLAEIAPRIGREVPAEQLEPIYLRGTTFKKIS